MPAMIIDGKELARRTRAELAHAVAELTATFGSAPGLAAILVGDDAASETYVRTKRRQAAECGIRSTAHRLAGDTTEADLLEVIQSLNADDAVDAILVQLPLPRHIAIRRVLDSVLPDKDVDGFHSRNAGLLAVGRAETVPCTPRGCLALLRHAHGDDETGRLGKLAGQHAVVVGRSSIVGRPMAALLTAENCTVTLAHSQTRNLPEVCQQADVLVAAVGRPEMVRGGWVRPGATVIDVGINRVEREGASRLVGDVAFDEAREIAGAITPVPGGVGPMTVAYLLHNTVELYRRRRTGASGSG